jgi:two-component system C4-dicarboxylate transport response regulator DctD
VIVADQTTKGLVLVVDDEPAVCALLSERLASAGYDCRSCESGQSALELLQAGPYEAIISDLNMPAVSGLDLLETARQKYPHTAFLMVTGVDDIRIGIEAMKKGADDYLVKPFQFDVVVASVRRALEKKRLEVIVRILRAWWSSAPSSSNPP